MTQTGLLSLPFIAAGQAQKHVTHNEALRMLDALTMLAVVDRDLATPPGTPAEGDRYIVPAGATGAWAGRSQQIAAWQDGAWACFAPRPGWLAYILDEQRQAVWSGTAWVSLPAGEMLSRLGINATPDAYNRFIVASAGALFTHDGAGHQLKLNKATPGDTASLVMQTAYSGRAEIGLSGDDRLRFKTSPDGASWTEAMVIDPATSNIGLGAAPTDARLEIGAAAGVSGRLGLVSEGGASSLQATSYGAAGGQFLGFMARGTKGTPVALQSGDVISGYGGRGWHGGGAFSLSSNAAIQVVASENHTGTARGAYIQFTTMKKGTAANLERAALADNGTLWVRDQGSFDARIDAHTRPVADTFLLASGSAEGGSSSVSVGCFGYGGATPGFRGGGARGTPSAPAATQANDIICFMGGHGHDGSSWSTAARAQVGFRASENWTPSANGSYLTFETTPTGSTSRQERVRVTAAGDMGIGTTPMTKLDVDGPVRVKSYTVAGVPAAATHGAGAMIHVSNESGGAVIAFSDGTSWRRVTDRAVIS